MSHAMLTMVAPLSPDRLADAQAQIQALGNPAVDTIRDALKPNANGDGLHFASMHAFASRHSTSSARLEPPMATARGPTNSSVTAMPRGILSIAS